MTKRKTASGLLLLLTALLVVGCTTNPSNTSAEGHQKSENDASQNTTLPSYTVEGSTPSTKILESTSPLPEAARGGAIFALLSNNDLLEISPENGRLVEHKVSLRPSYAGRVFPGQHLALSNDGRTLFVLALNELLGGSSRLIAVDAATLKPEKGYSLPEGIAVRSLAVGPKTGKIYLLGNRQGKKFRCADDATCRTQDAVVSVLDPSTSRMLQSETVRRAEGRIRDWLVFSGAVSPDERRLFVSYHGTSTSGVDWIDITSGGLERCSKRSPTGEGCVPSAHGGVQAYHDGALVTAGGTQIEEIGREGEVIKKWDARLGRHNHLMEFAMYSGASELFALGSCGDVGGLSRLDLQADSAELLAPTHREGVLFSDPSARQRAVCGDALAAGPGSLLAVGKAKTPMAEAGTQGSLLGVDGTSGKWLFSIETPAEPADVLYAQ